MQDLWRQGDPSVSHVWIRDFVTLPRLLTKRGYASFQGGKYWEGTYRDGGFNEGMKAEVGSHLPPGLERMKASSGGDGLALGRSTMQPLRDFLDAHRGGPFLSAATATLDLIVRRC